MLAFQPVTEHEIGRLLCTMPTNSSPLDVLPCSLPKTCTDVFAPAIARLANLSLYRLAYFQHATSNHKFCHC